MQNNPESIPKSGHCYVHKQMCPFHAETESMGARKPQLWVAGTTCTDECPTGSKRQLTGKAGLPFLIFMAEVRRFQPEFFLHECTHLFNVESLEKTLGDLYIIMPCPMSPHEFGVPYTRPRLLTWCVHKRLPQPMLRFEPSGLKAYYMGTELEGDVFFAAPQSWVQKYIARRAGKGKGFGMESQSGNSKTRFPLFGMEHIMSGGDLARIRTQEVEELLRRVEDVSDTRVSLTDGICMKGQTSSFSRVKTFMPSLMTRSVPWSFRWKRELLPVEALGVMGIPVFRQWAPERFRGIYGCPFQHLLSDMSDADVRRLAGNGMSLQVMGVAFCHGLASFALQPSTEAMPVAIGRTGDSGHSGSSASVQGEGKERAGSD